MKATFKPTNYTFEFKDNFFVEVLTAHGECSMRAAFADLCDAIEYAEQRATKSHVAATHVFSRDAQIKSFHNADCLRIREAA